MSNSYIGKSMKCTSKCMELVSFVVGFDIVELWTRDYNGNYHCAYVHASEQTLAGRSNMIVGHYPKTNQSHRISPKVCLYELRTARQYPFIPFENLQTNNLTTH